MAEILYSPETNIIDGQQAQELFTAYRSLLRRIGDGDFIGWNETQLYVDYRSTVPNGFALPDGKALGAANAPWADIIVPTRLLLTELPKVIAEDDAYEYAQNYLKRQDAFLASWRDESYVGGVVDRLPDPDSPALGGEINEERVVIGLTGDGTKQASLTPDQIPVWDMHNMSRLELDDSILFGRGHTVDTLLVTANDYQVARWIAGVIDERLPSLRS